MTSDPPDFDGNVITERETHAELRRWCTDRLLRVEDTRRDVVSGRPETAEWLVRLSSSSTPLSMEASGNGWVSEKIHLSRRSPVMVGAVVQGLSGWGPASLKVKCDRVKQCDDT